MIVGAYAWDVLLAGAVAFAFACVVFLLAGRRGFAQRPRLLALVLAAPFAKLAIELGRGVPRDSFFWHRIHGVRPESGSIQIGIGVDRWGPVVNLLFGANHHGTSSPQSVGDGLARMVDRRLGDGVSATLGLALLVVTLLAVARELVVLGRASRACRRHVRAGQVIETRRLGLLRVAVVRSSSWRGAPFAGGVLRPWICVSDALWSSLGPGEREAVLQHELSHLRWLDGALLAFARLGRAALWFLPGAGAALRRLSEQCELAADAEAIARGADPTALASALVRACERASGEPSPLLPFARDGRSTIVRRVHRLLDAPADAKRRWPLAVALVVTLAVLRMTAFGNL
jgi:hypothetical protein